MGIDSTGEVVPVNASGIVTPEGEASILDNSQPKNLFGETREEIPLIVGEKVINSDETSNHGSTVNATNTMGYFMTNNQSGIQNQKLYSCHIKFTGAGKMSVYLINLGGTGIITDVSMLPGTNTLSSLTALATKAFEFNITSADISGDVQEILLDGTDPRVININQDLLEDGYIKVPTGYYIALKNPTEDVSPNMCNFTYGGGDGATGSSFYYVKSISSSNPEGERAKSPTTSPSTTVGILGVGWSICVNEGTQEIVTQNFDTYLATEETTKSFELAMKVIPDSGTANRSKGGIYVFNGSTQGALNGKVLGGVEYYAVPGMTAEFVKATVPDNTAVASGTTVPDIADMWTTTQGSGVPSQYVLFRVNASDCTTDELTLFKLDGSDPRVEIVATDLYDAEQGGFPWNQTMMLALSDRRNPVTTGDGCMVYHTVVTGGSVGFASTSTTGVLTWGSATSTLSVNMYSTSTTTQQTVHSDIIATALSDIEELKERNTDSPLKGKWISFLGDSITTWQGWSNIAPGSTSADVWYPKSQYGMTDVNQSYWKKLIDRTGANLLVNNSWSGSRVSYGGHTGPVVDTGTGDRCKQLDKTVDGVARKPDYIVINIGTNDFDNNVLIGTWNGRGQRFPDDPDTLKPTTFREAYSVMLHRLRKNYPLAKIYCCTIPCGNVKSDGLNEINSEGVSLSEYNDAIREVATAYGVRIVELATSGLDYYTLSNFYCDSNLHPNEAGMERYYELIRGALESNDSSNVSTPRLSKLMTGTATAVADATDTSDVVAQLNALLAALRTRGVIAAS